MNKARKTKAGETNIFSVRPMSIFLSAYKKIIGAIFPTHCLSCRKGNLIFCEQCTGTITLNLQQDCPICRKSIHPYGRVCDACKHTTSLDGVFSAAPYKGNSALAKAIHMYKYESVETLSQSLGNILVKSIQRSQLPLPEYLCPVPLHPLRKRWRGFNQSELFADIISEQLLPQYTIPILKHLQRTRFTLPQMKVDTLSGRQENIRDAFEWDAHYPSDMIQGKRIWIIDDITTTTSTLNECAIILKRHGAKEVFGIVLAR